MTEYLDLTTHKGDFLTFGMIALATCPHLISNRDYDDLKRCHIGKARWVRHPHFIDHTNGSRSEISPDGIMGVLFHGLVRGDKSAAKELADKDFWLWKRCVMGSYGDIGYRFMGIPVLAARAIVSGSRFPKLPVSLIAKVGGTEGYRAYLVGMYLLCDYLNANRKASDWSIRMAERLYRDAPEGKALFFLNLWRLLQDYPVFRLQGPIPNKWGSCPDGVMVALCNFMHNIARSTLRGPS